jgi:transcriptional regulator with XRE-family HTH domain
MAANLQSWRKRSRLTLQQVADLVGTDKTQISKLERGQRRLTEGWLVRLAQAYGCEPGDLLNLPQAADTDKATSALVEETTRRDLPVRGLTIGTDGHLIFDPDPVEWCLRPPVLKGVRDAFALYVTDTSMEEVLLEGTLLMIHPSRPARPMDLVVVERATGEVSVQRLIRRTEEIITLRRYNPRCDYDQACADIRGLYRVVATQLP